MGRCRIVEPESVKLFFVDVHRRAHQELLKQTKFGDTVRKATEAEIAASLATIAEAEADGHWIDVKKRLNAGEQDQIFIDMVKDGETVVGEKPRLDLEKVTTSEVMQYLVGWSLVDRFDKPLPLSIESLNSCDPETKAEIRAAVERHVKQVDEERAARKNALAGGNLSSAISALPSAPAGDLVGSAN